MQKVVILNGSGGCGKGTFVGYLSRYVSVYECSIVDEAKKILHSYGWDGKKDERIRMCLCALLDALKIIDIPHKYLVERYLDFSQDDLNDIMTIDIRDPGDIERMVEFFYNVGCPVKTVLIERPSIEKITSNHADAGVANYSYDLIIENDGDIDDWDYTAKWFLDHFDELNGQKIKTTEC